jgi:hypothetical protein
MTWYHLEQQLGHRRKEIVSAPGRQPVRRRRQLGNLLPASARMASAFDKCVFNANIHIEAIYK